MNSARLKAVASGLLAFVAVSNAATPLTTGEVDIGIAYEGGLLGFHLHDEENDIEYEPSEAVLVVGDGSLQLSPGGAFSFLGPAGTPNWVLPAVENPGLLYLGLSGEELDAPDWVGSLTVSLQSVVGPGNFYLWNTDAFGNPVVFMDSASGISDGDRVAVSPGSHAHYNWGFSQPGSYSVLLEASGVHVDEGLVTSGPVAFQFEVVPEPSTYLLALLGLGSLLAIRRLQQ